MSFHKLVSNCREIIANYQNVQIGIAIMDENENQTFYHQEELVFRAASTIKIPIMLSCYINMAQKLDDIATIPNYVRVEGAGVIPFLSGNLPYTYRNLMELMIIVSDNTAANVLLLENSMVKVNKLLMKIGCGNSKIERLFMDEAAYEKGFDNTTTAKDMVKILQQFGEYSEVLNQNQRAEALQILSNQQLGEMLNAYTVDDEVNYFHKTGNLTGINHDIGIIKYRDKLLYVAVLTQYEQDNFTGKKCIADIGKAITYYLKRA
ncbi:serine hydrolase [Rummeliibacillus sp. JY-2-4R]